MRSRPAGVALRHARRDVADLVARVVASDELRIHLGDVSHEDHHDISRYRFDHGFELSDHVVIMPRFKPSYTGWIIKDLFPWILGVALIDYRLRLEAELTRHWGGFEEHEDDDAVVGEVDGIEIRRSVTVYRRVPSA